MKTSIFCIVILCFSLWAFGQNTHAGKGPSDALSRLEQKEMSGRVMIEMEPLIIENYNKHLVSNRMKSGINGFRIRIFSDNGMGAKENQKRIRASFLSLFPDIPTYPAYEGSYYKIYVGDFRTKRDALKSLDTIKRRFPDAFIVEYDIVIKE